MDRPTPGVAGSTHRRTGSASGSREFSRARVAARPLQSKALVRFRAAAPLALGACATFVVACGGPLPSSQAHDHEGRGRVAFAMEAPIAPPAKARALGAGTLLQRESTRARYESPTEGACPPDMVAIEGRYCIDRFEASLVEVLEDGSEQPLSPFGQITAKQVRAVSRRGVFPQGYISRNEAEKACSASGKRLCAVAEWQKACRGPENKQWGYAERRTAGTCNDRGRNPVIAKYGFGRWTWNNMNDGHLNQLGQTLSKTGLHEGCTNGYGVYDMVGNLHEWVADRDGTFYGGYYADVASVGHGEGCGYVTTAHEARYHDYSTGFRCCADPNRGGEY